MGGVGNEGGCRGEQGGRAPSVTSKNPPPEDDGHTPSGLEGEPSYTRLGSERQKGKEIVPQP